MRDRRIAVFSALFLSLNTVASFAHQHASNSDVTSFHDWKGYLTQTNLADGSVLSEYIAQTASSGAKGAFLSVSFVPRFNCLPNISFAVSDSLQASLPTGTKFQLLVGRSSVEFPSLKDQVSGYANFSLNGDSDMHKALRGQLDNASSASIALQKASGGDQSTDIAVADEGINTIIFSLRGSRQSVLNSEKNCRAHHPIPFAD